MSGIDTAALLSLLQHTSTLLRQMGSPAREQAAAAAYTAMQQQLAAAVASADAVAMAAAVTKALRLLMVQLKMLRMDAANFRLRMLATSLSDGSAIM